MSLILTPGAPPPPLVPFCGICDMPVERLQFDLTTDPRRIGIHSHCCNRTSATRIDISVYLELLKTGQKLYTIVRKGSTAGLRARKRADPRITW